ncbi:MAG: hypothetical protein QGI49_09915 [SAR202 cluster bacterium]|jgi:hypothetical protein|nr:hypothetical protein [SAR202 cluster bacterium]
MSHVRFAGMSGLAASVALLLVSVPAFANGRVQNFVTQSAGPYTLAIGTIPETPVVGNLHLTISVADESTGAYVLDAEVSVTGAGPRSEVPDLGPIVAEKNPLDPTFYDINTFADRVGAWKFTIDVSGELGDASTEIEIEVTSISPIAGILTIVGLVAFLLVLGLSVRVFLKQQRNALGSGRAR